MASSKLDEFLSSLASVPPEVARSLALLKILDLKVLHLMQETKNLVVKCKEDLSPTDRQYYLDLLQHKQRDAVACSAEKVCIVLQLMDTMRRCISALDQELTEVSKDLNPTRQEVGPAVGLKEEEGMELNLDLEDVNGRVYCVCQRPSHGLMVACDNPKVSVTQCPYEWFHFECVGLQSQPVGAWFCANCA